jgi:hypothetical protein
MPNPNEEFGLQVSGVDEVCVWLERLHDQYAKSALARALAAAAVPIVADIADRTPELAEGERDENVTHLVDSLRTQIEIDAEGRGGRAQISFGKRGYLALWLEFGWKLTGHKPEKKFIKNVPEHGDTYLTGSQRHFMRDGLEAATEESINKFLNSFAGSLDEYAAYLKPAPVPPK